MPDWISEFQTLDTYSVLKLKRTAQMKSVVWSLDIIRMYSSTVYLLSCRMGCCTTITHFTALHLLSIWDLIARLNIPMPTKGSCLNLITSGSKIQTVTSKKLSRAEFLLLQDYTSPGLHQIRSSNVRSSCPPESRYQLIPSGATRLTNGYYVLNLKNVWWWFQKVQISTLLGQLCWHVHRDCQTERLDAYCTCQSNCWTSTFAARKCCIR